MKRVDRRKSKIEGPKRRMSIEEHDINMKMKLMVEQKYPSCLEENAIYHVHGSFHFLSDSPEEEDQGQGCDRYLHDVIDWDEM